MVEPTLSLPGGGRRRSWRRGHHLAPRVGRRGGGREQRETESLSPVSVPETGQVCAAGAALPSSLPVGRSRGTPRGEEGAPPLPRPLVVEVGVVNVVM